MNDVAKNIPKISATLEESHVEHQSTMIEIEGTIWNQYVSIFIDLGDSLSYISLQIVEKYKFKYEKFKNVCLV